MSDNSILPKVGKSARERIENFLVSHQKVPVEMAGRACCIKAGLAKGSLCKFEWNYVYVCGRIRSLNKSYFIELK